MNLIKLTNTHGLEITLSPLGAAWISCQIPMPKGKREILLGYQSPEQSLESSAYLGVTVGRYAGRIANARYHASNGKMVQLPTNQGANILHGGKKGFSTRLWEVVEQYAHKVVFRLFSPTGDEGFTGNLTTYASYELTENNTVNLCWTAQTDAETVVNLTNHAYFNLNGDPNQAHHLNGLQQILQIHSEAFVPVDQTGIPIANAQMVSGGMDFRSPVCIADQIGEEKQQLLVGGGFDHSYLLASHEMTTPVAILQSNNQDLRLEIMTNQPALHIYSGNYLSGTPNRYGTNYENFAGLAIETQAPPNSPNTDYALVCLKEGERYHKESQYRFSW